MTQTKAIKAIRDLEPGILTATTQDGEIRVRFVGSPATYGYFTTNPEDALATAKDMLRRAKAGEFNVKG